MELWKLNRCPRCRDDIYIEIQKDRWCEQCLQCGYLRDIPGKVEVYQHAGSDEKTATQRRKHPQR